MISLLTGWKPVVIASAIGLAAFGVQSTRLHFASLRADALQRDLATCSARAANMELRRRVEDEAATSTDPLGELRRDFTRPN